ncbi:MAG: DUF308 domain-containing protein [Treponema sp.]|nr:DUF308 domain-containing protein [Treponema sp.]
MNRNWLFSTLIFITGLLLVIFPNFCADSFVVIMGLCAVVAGFYDLTQSRLASSDNSFQKVIMGKGVGLIICGLLAVILPFPVRAAFKVMTYILAAYLIVSAVAGFFAAGIIRKDAENRKELIMENLLSLLAAVLLIIVRLDKLIRIIGIVVLIFGIVYIAFTVLESRNNIYATDVTVKDDDSE